MPNPLARLCGLLILIGIVGADARADLPGEVEAWRFEFPVAAGEDRLHSSVYSITQDRTGFLWVGTENGLYRYNGYGFTRFLADPYGDGSPADQDISYVYEDSTGLLWIGTWGGGLDRLDPRTGRFTNYPSDPDLPGHLRDDRVQTVFEDSRGAVWVGTFAGGLARFDRETETFTSYRYDEEDPTSLPHDRVWSIAEHSTVHSGAAQTSATGRGEAKLWVATSAGLALFDRTAETFTVLRSDLGDPSSLGHAVVRVLYVDRRGALWIGSQNGLQRFRNAEHPEDVAAGSFERWLDDSIVNVIFEDSNANFWVGTNDHGLILLDRADGSYRSLRHDPRDPTSVSDNDVRTLYEDRSRVLWIGTRDGGLNKVDLKPRKFQHVTHHPDDPASLRSRVVRSLAEDGRGRLWVGTNDGVARYDDAERRFVHLPYGAGEPRRLPGSDVHLLFTDRSGDLWVGVWRGGLSRYLGDGKGFETLRHDGDDPTSLASDIVTTLIEDRAGLFWIGTDRGLSLFHRERGTLEHFRSDPGDPASLSDNLVWTIYEDGEGAVWVGTDSGGLHRFDAVRRRFERFQHDPEDPRSLSHNRVFAIHQPTSGRMWIGTADGLNEVLADGTFRRYQAAEGLSGTAVLAVLSDPRGHLWLSTHQGISRFDPAAGTFRNYTARDTLQRPVAGQEGQFLARVALERRDGRLLFGGNNGFICFHPDHLLDNPYVPPVVLTGFQRFDQPIELPPASSPVPAIELSYRDNFFEIEFAALDFTNPRENRYRYRLDGHDDYWIEAGTRRSAPYPNVGPGSYVFRVQGSNNDGVWNEEGLTVRLKVTPPWWLRVWARLAGAFLVIVLGTGIYRWQVHRHTLRERELQRRVEESHSELRRSEARYRKLFERNLAGVVRATIDGRILDCNDAFARIFGYGSREQCRLRHRLRFGKDEEHRTLLEQLRRHGSYESADRTRDGSRVTLLWNASLVMDETAEGLVIEGTVIDISERQRVEERMRREQKLESLEVLAGGIAHDFNNLLVGVLGNAELARMELGSDSPVAEHLDEIERAAHRAASLSKKMLAYSGKGRFVTVYLDLSTSIEEALPLIPVSKNIRMKTHLEADLPSVQADASQFHQLLSNLISNAAEAIGEEADGTITVTTGERHCDRGYLAETYLDEDLEEGLYVFLEVRDDGPGIEPDVQPKIFDPFFTTGFPGRGLGLPVVLGIVRGHRGALKISSEPGGGTVARVLFPASAEGVTAPIELVRVDKEWRGSGKVLVVDDEPMVRKIAGQMLEMLGFEVLDASDGDEGVEAYRRHGDEIVLVLLDLTMPRMSGEQAFHEIRRQRPDARVLLASGYEKQHATEHFEGLAGFIQKPYRMATLREKVRRALGV